MSKEAALRAMREARYAQRMDRAAAPAVRPRIAKASAPVAPPGAAAPVASDETCGHRSINGRACTREQGHTAKNHRYT